MLVSVAFLYALPLQSPWLNCLARFTSVMHLHYELGSVLLDSLL